jgi:uncharacterized protein YlxP (DUF503 family)
VKEGKIHVAVGRVHLDLPGCHSLKAKRKVIRPLVQRLRDRFGVSAAEVGYHDMWHSSVIALAATGGDAGQLDGLMQDAMAFVRRNADAVVVDLRVEVLSVGEIHAPPVSGRAETSEEVASIETGWLAEEDT